MTYTKLPWGVSHDNHDGWPLVMAGGKIIANVNLESFSAGVADLIEMPAEANARRIVACVNACDGLDTELLEKIVSFGGTLPRRLEAMTNWEQSEAEKQRDELAEAIRLTLDENGHLADGDVCTLKRLKDALAKVGAGGTATEGHNAAMSGEPKASPLDGTVRGENPGKDR